MGAFCLFGTMIELHGNEASMSLAGTGSQRQPSRRCWICLQGGGSHMDLICPCVCLHSGLNSGHKKFVHRLCLDLWRMRNAAIHMRGLTHCSKCNAPYVLKLQRSPTEQVHPWRCCFAKRYFPLWVMALQLPLCLLVIIIYAVDAKEKKLFSLFAGHRIAHTPEPGVSASWDILRCMSAYYLVAVLIALLLLILGVIGVVCYKWSRCSPSSLLFPGGCPLRKQNYCGLMGMSLIIAVTLSVVAGIYIALVALITWLQRMVQVSYQLREIKQLTKEYVVQDLSEASANSEPDSVDVSLDPSGKLSFETEEETLQHLFIDLKAVYGYAPSHVALTNFLGSSASLKASSPGQ